MYTDFAEHHGPDQVIYYQYKADRAGRTLGGIDEQVAKAEKAVIGLVGVEHRTVRREAGVAHQDLDVGAGARGLPPVLLAGDIQATGTTCSPWRSCTCANDADCARPRTPSSLLAR
jgi:hypothetical protein